MKGPAMASKAEQIRTLRSKTKNILCSTLCNQIRFRLDDIHIDYLMYNYVAGLIDGDKMHIGMDSGRNYSHETDTLRFESDDIPPWVIVHEATHALIDAVYPGRKVTKGTHEACAYLAETMYSLVLRGEFPDLEIPYLSAPVYRLAKNVMEYNSNHKDAYVCPSGDVDHIKAIMSKWMDINSTETMNGMAAFKK
jgi:hypothetical protein